MNNKFIKSLRTFFYKLYFFDLLNLEFAMISFRFRLFRLLGLSSRFPMS